MKPKCICSHKHDDHPHDGMCRACGELCMVYEPVDLSMVPYELLAQVVS